MQIWRKIFHIIAILAVVVNASDNQDVIKVHFIPHSHLDAGWLQTYDYYYQR